MVHLNEHDAFVCSRPDVFFHQKSINNFPVIDSES